MSNDTVEQQLIHLLKSNTDIIECPPINVRLLTGLPNPAPIVWVNDNILSEADSEAYSQAAHDSDQIELYDFKGQNGLTYYRYRLVVSDPL